MANVIYPAVSILPRLFKRFTAQTSPLDPAEALPIIPAIYLISSVDELLKTAKIEVGTQVLPGATGAIIVLTVPNGKRWDVRAFRCYRSNGAAEEINTLEVFDGTSAIQLDVYTATSDYSSMLIRRCILEEGWSLRVNVSTHNAGDGLTAQAYVLEEDAYIA